MRNKTKRLIKNIPPNKFFTKKELLQYKKRKKTIKRKRKRKIKPKRKQRGGVRFRDIITGENKSQFIGQEVEIIKIDNDYIAETDMTGWCRIDELINKPGFIQIDNPGDIILYGEPRVAGGGDFLTVYFPESQFTGALGRNVILSIPSNLRQLAYREGIFRPLPAYGQRRNYYVQLRRRRIKEGGITEDLFSKERLSRLNKMAHRRSTINPRLYKSQTPRIETLRGSIDPNRSLYDVTKDVFTGKRPPTALYDKVRGKDKSIDITPDMFDLIRSHLGKSKTKTKRKEW